jgi:hypothetical protein
MSAVAKKCRPFWSPPREGIVRFSGSCLRPVGAADSFRFQPGVAPAALDPGLHAVAPLGALSALGHLPRRLCADAVYVEGREQAYDGLWNAGRDHDEGLVPARPCLAEAREVPPKSQATEWKEIVRFPREGDQRFQREGDH